MDAITVIITIWKRDHLEEQLQSLLKQTIRPKVIWVQQTQQHVDVNDVLHKYREFVTYTYQEENQGVFGRFESVTQVSTPYCYIIDDDIIPGYGFLENALNASKRLNAIISPNGRLLNNKTKQTKVYIGDGYEFQHSFCLQDTEVDFGNNSWFFKTEWINYFLKELPLYRTNGEDIHLSATCKLFGNIPTYVPKQIIPYEAGNTKRIYSLDEFSLHCKPRFSEERVEVISYFENGGWELSYKEKALPDLCRQSTISVVMPVDNIKNANASIESILNQSFKDFEFIVIHSKSNIRLKFNDKRIVWVNTMGNISYYTMLNIGCALATSKYICIMNNNYISLKSRLQLQYELMEKDESIVASGQPSSEEIIEYSSLIIRRDVLHQTKYYKDLSNLPNVDLIHRLNKEGDIRLFPENLIKRISN